MCVKLIQWNLWHSYRLRSMPRSWAKPGPVIWQEGVTHKWLGVCVSSPPQSSPGRRQLLLVLTPLPGGGEKCWTGRERLNINVGTVSQNEGVSKSSCTFSWQNAHPLNHGQGPYAVLGPFRTVENNRHGVVYAVWNGALKNRSGSRKVSFFLFRNKESFPFSLHFYWKGLPVYRFTMTIKL